MSMAALFSSPYPHSSSSYPSSKSHPTHKPFLSHTHHKPPFLVPPRAQNDGVQASSATVDGQIAEKKVPEPSPANPTSESAFGQSGSQAAAVARFEDPRWVQGTWDLNLFQKEGKTNWDAVIDAEVRRRKWLQDNPEASSNDNPGIFDTAIIPWWAWMKRFHLPEAEKLNGRAAMIGFFMAYLVDGLTGLGLVDQTGNFICRTLLFAAVAGILVIRKNEDIETLKKLVEETTFYDKQWQATWKDETSKIIKNE